MHVDHVTGEQLLVGIIHRAVLKRVRKEKYLARLIAIRIGTTFGGTNQVTCRAIPPLPWGYPICQAHRHRFPQVCPEPEATLAEPQGTAISLPALCCPRGHT